MSDTSAHIAVTAQLACLLEASAAKPGNVSPGAGFGDTRYEHFLASAAAIGPALGSAGAHAVGETILQAVTATRRWTSGNTNLGIVLLLAPLSRAASDCLRDRERRDSRVDSTVAPSELRRALHDVLAGTTVDDARAAYAAIRLATPSGLGSVGEQDVAADPTVTLTDAMRLAADRDGIAREYVTDFQATFECAVPALQAARRDGLVWNDAVVEAFLTVLATAPDTHIARRAGTSAAEDVTRLARAVIADGGVRSDRGRAAVERMRATLRDAANSRNPGTSADITAAAIFVVLLDGGWNAPNDLGGQYAASR